MGWCRPACSRFPVGKHRGSMASDFGSEASGNGSSAQMDQAMAPAPVCRGAGTRTEVQATPRTDAPPSPGSRSEVTYLTWADDNLLRQVSYHGQREDKPARPMPHLARESDGLSRRVTQAAWRLPSIGFVWQPRSSFQLVLRLLSKRPDYHGKFRLVFE